MDKGKFVFSIVLSILAIFQTQAQEQVKAGSFVKDTKVYLRFILTDFKSFEQCKDEGMIIKRIAWDSQLLPDTTNFKGVAGVSVKPFDKVNSKWDSLITINSGAGFIYNLLYEPTGNAKGDLSMAYGLAMLGCDLSVDLSIAAGTFYAETPLVGKYAYLIRPKNSKLARAIKPAIVLVNSGVSDVLKEMGQVKIKGNKKEIQLDWDVNTLMLYYGGYFIERSEDGKQYTVLNKTAIVQIRTKDEPDKKNILYVDNTADYNKTYYYRIRGLGYFGIYGNYSDVVKWKLMKPLEAFPLGETPVLLKGDSTLEIHWSMPDGFDRNELSGFDILRSETAEGTYTKINKAKLSKETMSFVDQKPKQANYYKVLALGINGDSTLSHHMMGLIPDKTPPAVPVGLQGKIDSLGKVRLSWKPNKESDLKGYRIFRNNAMNEELVEVTTIILTDTVFKDSVELNTLSEDVFYSITAVDMVYNNSPYAKTIKLKRPDKIKPVEAQFEQVIHTDSCIVVKWIPSTSKDAEKYELWRTINGGALQKIKEWKASDSLRQYLDTQLEYGSYYQYNIKVIDDDRNFSTSTSSSHYFDSRIRRAIKKINYKVNLEQRSITLNWEYPEKDLYSFQIYKGKEGEALKIIKTVKASQLMFEDKELYIGNKYVYKIKAIYNSGAESKMSDEINVNF